VISVLAPPCAVSPFCALQVSKLPAKTTEFDRDIRNSSTSGPLFFFGRQISFWNLILRLRQTSRTVPFFCARNFKISIFYFGDVVARQSVTEHTLRQMAARASQITVPNQTSRRVTEKKSFLLGSKFGSVTHHEKIGRNHLECTLKRASRLSSKGSVHSDSVIGRQWAVVSG
jgi:hypothetical protein